MINKEQYEQALEYQKKAEKILRDDDLSLFIPNFIAYLENIHAINLVTYYHISDIEYREDNIYVEIDEGEYGTTGISIPTKYLWMPTEEWMEIEKKKFDDEKLQEKMEEETRKEKEERETLRKLKEKYGE